MKRLIRSISFFLLSLACGALPLAAATHNATAGQSVTLTAGAAGTAPFTYQWFKNGTTITGATSASYVMNPVTTTHAGDYTVKVTNSAGSATSTATTLAVTAATAPTITTQPTNKTVTEGGSVTFAVVASGTGPFTYQWKKGGTNISGATGSTYTISSASTAAAGSYTVAVSNIAGTANSNAATLTVNSLVSTPIITSHPESVTILQGRSVTFSVVATGTGTLTYQWRKNGTNITGATTASYTISSVSATSAADYTVRITNSAGSVISDPATLTVTALVLAPEIKTDLVNQAVFAGDPFELSLKLGGTAPFTYQWRKGGVNIVGATAATFKVTSATLADAGSYSVVVTNEKGSVTSRTAVVSVEEILQSPEITGQPMGLTVDAGAPVTLSVTATGTGPLSYQWMLDDIDIPGAKSATYKIESATAMHIGSYRVYVWNSVGSVLSQEAVLTINGLSGGSGSSGKAKITEQPKSKEVSVGQSTTLSVVVSGTESVSYQWYKDGVAIDGAIYSTYTIGQISDNDFGTYTVEVTTASGTFTSEAAKIIKPGSTSGRLANLSVRSVAGRNGQPLIVGFVTSGSSAKQVLVRATGPALEAFGVQGVLSDPKIALYDGSTLVTENDNWADGGKASSLSTTFARLGAFALTDAASKDTAILASFSGLRTVHVNSTKSGESGVVLVEAYDADTTSTTELNNASALNFAGVGSETLVLGFVIGGSSPKKVLIRGIGPGLSSFGVSGVLADPVLELHKIEGGVATLVNSNDNWDSTSATAAVFSTNGAFSLATNSNDAALVVTLSPGAYTASVSGKNGLTGTAMVEMYAAK